MPLRHRCAEETALRIAVGVGSLLSLYIFAAQCPTLTSSLLLPGHTQAGVPTGQVASRFQDLKCFVLTRALQIQGRRITAELCAHMESCIRVVVRVWDADDKEGAEKQDHAAVRDAGGGRNGSAGFEAECEGGERQDEEGGAPDTAHTALPRGSTPLNPKPAPKATMSSMAYVWQCTHCPYMRLQPVGSGGRCVSPENASHLDDSTTSVGGHCGDGECEGGELALGGPVWAGALCCREFVAACEREVKGAGERTRQVGCRCCFRN